MITAIRLSQIPTCSQVGSLTLTDEALTLANQMKTKILAKGGYVERQAIAINPVHEKTTHLNYILSDYATIRTLRERSMQVATIGSGTILCCPERQQIFLQRRSATTEIYPHKLASFGGHYSPDHAEHGFGALLDTLIDEVYEEAGINLLDLAIDLNHDLPPIFFIMETDTGGIQFTPIAFALTPEQADQIKGSDEGHIETYDLVKDFDFLLNPENWSQMGFSCFMTWKELGFPVQKNWNSSTFI
jgi:8-oxo-dGTP pyrophosphatase MutT (NUDIX family)